MTERLTSEQVAAAADALAADRPKLPPMPARDVLDHYHWLLSELVADLWTLRESIEARRRGDRACAVGHVPALTEHLAEALALVEQIAGDLDLRLTPAD